MKPDPSQRELLKSGAISYPQAFAAMLEFCRVISTMIREAFEQNVSRLSEAMAVPLSVSDLKGRAKPSSIHPDNAGADGVRAQIGFAIWGDPDWRQYYYLTWEKSGIWISAGIKFKDESAAAKIVSSVRQHGEGELIWQDGHIVGIKQKLDPEEILELQSRMSDLLTRWERLWRSIGGIGGCLPPRSTGKMAGSSVK